jgi:toxin-antitoxin system PIN domain toxin
MRPALLDINVLLALFDPLHTHHQLAGTWLRESIKGGWATCPITEAGFVRVVSQSSYPNPIPVGQAVTLLRSAQQSDQHQFWPCDLSLADPKHIDTDYLLGPKQVTDAYLLALAVANGGRFVTFDQRVVPAIVPGADQRSLEVLVTTL